MTQVLSSLNHTIYEAASLVSPFKYQTSDQSIAVVHPTVQILNPVTGAYVIYVYTLLSNAPSPGETEEQWQFREYTTQINLSKSDIVLTAKKRFREMENVIVARDGDEELSLFLEMRRREKFQDVSSLPEPGRDSVDKSSTESLLRRSAVEKFLDSENDKSDYEWLLAAPETTQGQENSMVKLKEPTTRFTALKPRVENIPQEPVTRSVKAFKPIPRTAFSKQAITELKPSCKPSRQATPTSRATFPTKRETNSTRNANTDNRTSSIKSTPRASERLTRSSSVGRSAASSAKSTSTTIPEIPARPVSTSRSRVYNSGERSKGRSKISNDVNPVLMGTQMVERVVNMRKLPPPKQDDNTSSGFGRTLSRSSLDMALRHMNIRRSISKNLRVTNSMDKNESS